ncbi:MAG: hypothetical protein AAFO07_21590 [Bacteroidota bacterium]
MNFNFLKKAVPFLCLLIAFSFSVNAQKPVSKSKANTAKLKQDVEKMRISEADRKAIIGLFKGVDQSKYKLQFYNGERKSASKYGRLNYKMNDLQRVAKVSNSVGAAGYIVLIVEGDDVIYVLAVGSGKLKNVLGAQKAARLDKIMAKYN